MAPRNRRSLLLLYCSFLCSLKGLYCSSELELSTGIKVTIPVPSFYQDGFLGRAFLAKTTATFPPFKAALNVESVDGKHLCSLLVLLGDVKVWASDHVSKFQPRDMCALELSKDGEMQLVDAAGTIGWSSQTSGRLVKKLRLMETGNLLLTNVENGTEWQSFDHPGDTLLWSQVIGASGILTSFLANSTSFFYSLEIQQARIALYLNVNDSKYLYWDHGANGNRSMSFIKLGSRGLKLLDNREHKIAQIKATHPEPVRFLTIGRSGLLTLYYYSAIDGSFKASYRAPDGLCNLPLSCGAYGICTQTNSCSCPLLPSRQYDDQLPCGDDDALMDTYCGTVEAGHQEMKEIDGVGNILRTEPYKYNGNIEECKISCRDDCSCHAAMYTNNSRECFHYHTLGGMREVGKRDRVSYWVKVPNSTSGSKSKKIKRISMIVAGAVDGVAVCSISGGVLYYLHATRKKERTRVANTETYPVPL